MTSKTAIKVGIIGLGRMGRNHLRVLSMLQGAEVGFVFDRDQRTTSSVAQAFGVLSIADPEEGMSSVDAVVIASPTATHADYIALAARHVTNIFVEKPMAGTLGEAEAMQRLVKKAGINLQVGFIERFNPAVSQLKRVLDSSTSIISIDFTRTNKLSDRITDVDVIADLMIHDLDLALFLNGPVSDVMAHGIASDGRVEFATAILTHSNGRLSRVMASRITEKKMRLIQATCRDMFVDCDLLRKEIVISRQSRVTQPIGDPYTITAAEETLEVPPQEALLLELQAFLQSCAGNDQGDRPGAEAGVASMRLCAAIQDQILATS